MNRKKILLLILAGMIVVGAFSAFAILGQGGVKSSEAALAVFNVENLSCSSCVRNIQQALAKVDGVGQVEVSVTAGRSEVEFDQRRIGAEEIAQTITAAGYPAQIREILSAEDFRDLKTEHGRLGKIYIARIGERLLPRQEFDQVFSQRLAQTTQPLAVEARDSLRLQVWEDLLSRELLLGAAEARQVIVQDGEVEREIAEIKAGHAGIDELIEKRFGSQAAFARQIKNNLIIRRHLEQNVADPSLPEPQRQQALEQWYRQLVDKTRVVIFDPALKAAASSGGAGCGGSCCG